MTTDKYLYHNEEITIPESFQELSDIVMRYEDTMCADAAIDAFEYWNLPMTQWPDPIPEQCFEVAKMIATWSHNYHLSVAKASDSWEKSNDE